jgi:coenzyme F420 hydrogenase subunit beta
MGDMFHPGTSEKVPNLTNILIRTTKGKEWIRNAERRGYIKVSPLKMARVFWNTGLELKKHGSVYRLSERKKMGWPVPDYHLPLDISLFKRKNVLP